MITSWMKGLVIYLLLSGLVLKLVPGKSYERYVSFYMGLILVIMLARPVFLLFGLSNKDMDALINKADSYLDFNDFFDSEKTVDYSQSTYYELGLGEALKESCIKEGYEVFDVSLITDKNGNLISVTLYVKGDFDENVLKNYINEVYKIDMKSIYIVRR